MPIAKNVKVASSRLKAGDVIVKEPQLVVTGKLLFRELPITVASCTKKTKNVVVTVKEGDERFTIDATAQVTVVREVDTREDVVARYAEEFVRQIDANVNAVKDAEAKFMEKVEKNGLAYGISWGYANDVIAAEVRQGFAVQAKAALEEREAEVVEVARWILEDATRSLVRGARGSSRSTSSWSNLVEDVRTAAYAEFLDTWSGFGATARQLIDASEGKYDPKDD